MSLPPTLRRCLLFVPGTRPDRFPKAAASGADTICLDLEDSVPPAEKGMARKNVLAYLAGPSPERPVERAVRFNALSTQEGIEDLLAFVHAGCVPDLIVLPKVRDTHDLRIVRDLWSGAHPPLLCIVETAAGILHAAEIAAHAGAGVLFGAADLSAEMDIGPTSESLVHARSHVILAGRAARVGVLDSPYLAVRDTQGLREETSRARAEGFTGKAAIHPEQVPVIQSVFTPNAEEIERARRALAAFTAGGERATLFEGQLLERPMIEACKRTLLFADRAPTPST